uniref:Transcription factor IIIC subunit 5 HTH domain-containing protein n=1 Tax=Chenopodium quinoa TaxID=63459 RepID=A0A803M5I8_CHEQI
MGIIEDGTAKGFLPSEELFAVHYPAYPSSMSRAVETLGGIDAIAKARSSKLNKLELRFRPEDPCSHPAFGQIYPCNNLLLKISKGNSGGIQSNNCCSSQSKDCSSEKSEKPNVLSADIVARVPEAYNFTGMVDYQHVLAVHADAAQRKGSYNEVKGPFGKIVSFLCKLRPSITLSSKKKQEGVVQHRWEIPKRVNWEEYISRGSDQWKWQMVVSKLFDERPIWTRSSIHERLCKEGLKFGDHMLKRLLFRSAYYFGSGPFHRFWIRKGYDPRKDPESRIYQRIDFRVPPSLRGYCDAASGLCFLWYLFCSIIIVDCSTGWYTSYVLDSLRLGVAVRFLSVYPLDGAESLLKRVSEKFEKSKKMRYQVNNLKPGEEGELQANPGASNQQLDGADVGEYQIYEQDSDGNYSDDY